MICKKDFEDSAIKCANSPPFYYTLPPTPLCHSLNKHLSAYHVPSATLGTKSRAVGEKTDKHSALTELTYSVGENKT